MLPEDLPTVLWVLLGLMAFMLILIWIGQMRMRSRLARIEAALRHATPSEMDEKAALKEQKAANSEQKRQFQEFLDENPARAELPKKEQFAAFREWRSERGLNWGKGDN